MLQIIPEECLQDEIVDIRVQDARPYQPLTISCLLEDHNEKQYFSYAQYYADFEGRLSTYINSSVSGSYVGRFPMGLVSLLAPAPHEAQDLRLFKKDVLLPNKLKIQLHEDHIEPKDLFCKTKLPLDSKFHYRHYMSKNVSRIVIRNGRVRGTLFVPNGKGPFPAVLDLFGTAGGLLEYKSAQLASRGFVSLALAYFDYDDLPSFISPLELEYFEEAVKILLDHPKVMTQCGIGAFGISKGGDLVLSLATYIPEIKAAVCVNGCCANSSIPLHKNGQVLLPSLKWNNGRAKMLDNLGLFIGLADNPLEYPETIIPVEKADAHFLYIVGSDDMNWRSSEFTYLSVERLKKAGKNNYKVCEYPGAGHLLEPPYSPLCAASYHKVFRFSVHWGGYGRPHSEAQVDSWNELLCFFKEHLISPTAKY